MANLPENILWESVYRWETSDPLLAGPGGIMNVPPQQLVNRTAWLRDGLMKSGTYAGVSVLSSSSILTANDVAKMIIAADGVETLTLPTPSAIANGRQIVVAHRLTTNTPITVTAAAGIDGSTTVQVRPNETVTFISSGTAWYSIGRNVQLIGEISAFGAANPPLGWLQCAGQAVSRTVYSELFQAVGITFGVGDGSTTFNLPDMRGEFIRGWDAGRGVDTGRVLGSPQDDLFKSHAHQITGSNVTSFGGAGAVPGVSPAGTESGGLTDFTGGTETRPRNVALNFCIKF